MPNAYHEYACGGPCGRSHGTAVVVVDRGEPVMSTLKTERVSIDDLMAAARNEGIERLADIKVAVLETNGRISFFDEQDRSGAPDNPTVGQTTMLSERCRAASVPCPPHPDVDARQRYGDPIAPACSS